jgi:peptidoglycan/xylan/chitin deacetylase (PgdA/CDA1 family)
MNSFSFEKSYLVVSYHYLRQTADKDPFPRVLGPDWETFRFHVSLIEQNFNIITLEQVLNFHEKKQDLPGGKPNMLFTFDDGLAEHHTAAQLLAERGIKGVFFIPTCLLREKVPINSSVIHYTIAKYGIGRFLEVYREGLNFHKLNQEKYALFFEKGTDNPWQKIAEIKNKFKYELSLSDCQKINTYIYEHLLLKFSPDIFSKIHLSEQQMHDIVALGHDIGSHSHFHVSLEGGNLSPADWQREVVDSQAILTKELTTSVMSIAYPFGEKKDFTRLETKLSESGVYRLGFIADEPVLNTLETPPFKIARYLPLKADTPEIFANKMAALLTGQNVQWRHLGLASAWKM